MALAKLKDLAARAGRWLGLSAAAAHTTAVVSDRFDTMTWRDTYAQAPALRDLATDLGQRHDYAEDLLSDTFLAAYKAAPEVRDASDMDPSRLVNHQITAHLLASPEFAGLRRETAGDPYASAMAVIAQGGALRRMLEQAREAQRAAEDAARARWQAAETAQDVASALEEAAAQAGREGDVPAAAARAVQQAENAAAQAADAAQAAASAAAKALATAAPGIRSAARACAAKAAEAAREEAELMTAWGVGRGELQRMPFDQRARLAERLRSGRLGQFAELIGRFRRMAAGQRARKTEHAPGQLVGVTLGDDLGRLIPSEAAALGVPALRAAFAARYAEQRLFVYDTRGEENTGQGAIIACVDCSGSMSGLTAGSVSGEAWAKACALALLDQARAGHRDFAVILFSSASQHKTFRFPAGQPPRIRDVLDFAEFFWGGGTDFATPLSAAAELLQAEYNDDGRMRGDIVLITDGECGVTEDWTRAWTELKHTLGFRLFGIAVGADPGPVLTALSDNVRTITGLTSPDDVSDIFRVT